MEWHISLVNALVNDLMGHETSNRIKGRSPHREKLPILRAQELPRLMRMRKREVDSIRSSHEVRSREILRLLSLERKAPDDRQQGVRNLALHEAKMPESELQAICRLRRKGD